MAVDPGISLFGSSTEKWSVAEKMARDFGLDWSYIRYTAHCFVILTKGSSIEIYPAKVPLALSVWKLQTILCAISLGVSEANELIFVSANNKAFRKNSLMLAPSWSFCFRKCFEQNYKEQDCEPRADQTSFIPFVKSFVCSVKRQCFLNVSLFFIPENKNLWELECGIGSFLFSVFA